MSEILATVEHGETFPYYHDGAWKEGYYLAESRLFVGIVNVEVATLIKGVPARYIENLKAAKP